MNIDTITIIIAIGINYALLVGLIWNANRQILSLNNQLQGLMREYKICKASMDGDYKTAGILRNISRNGVIEESPIPAENKEEPPGSTITQRG